MIGTTWGATPAGRAARLHCDNLMPDAAQLDCAISIAAPPAVVFAWLCQLRVAPYSYDLLDNTGRRSPRTRSSALTDLAVGQPFVRIFGRTYVFELAAFAPNEHITLQPRTGSAMSRFGSVSNTYKCDSVLGTGTCPYSTSGEVTMSCTTPLSNTCTPWRTVTGPDHHNYVVATYVLTENPVSSARTVKKVTVVVRDGQTTSKVLARETSTFDCSTGQPYGSCPTS